jgi:hypothetical protein
MILPYRIRICNVNPEINSPVVSLTRDSYAIIEKELGLPIIYLNHMTSNLLRTSSFSTSRKNMKPLIGVYIRLRGHFLTAHRTSLQAPILPANILPGCTHLQQPDQLDSRSPDYKEGMRCDSATSEPYTSLRVIWLRTAITAIRSCIRNDD